MVQLYQDLLGRLPEPAGLAYWAGLLDQGRATTYQVAFSIQNSTEHHTREVQQLYQRLLRRAADPSGLATWVGYLDAGAGEQAVETALLGSEEYFRRIGGGTATGFLQALYEDVLGRPLDPLGAQGWGGALAQGTSPGAIAAAVLASPEAQRDAVEALYTQYLHRATDPTGLAAFTGDLARGLPLEWVSMLLLGSPEYYLNAQ